MSKLNGFKDAQQAMEKVKRTMVSVYEFQGDPNAVKEVEPVMIRASILERKFGLDNFLILKAVKPLDDEAFDPVQWKGALEFVLGRGLIHEGRRFRLVGASSSLKDGKFWMAEEALIPEIHRYFKSAQEALTYFGIFTSSCHHGLWELDESLEIVADGEHGTGDGFGFVPERLLDGLGLPRRQIQVRFVGSQWLGKGTLHPYNGERLILPESMIKGAGEPDGQKYWFGVRDVAETRRYASNFTVAQWFDADVHAVLRPVVDRKLQVIREAFESPEKALVFLGMVSRWDDQQSDFVDPDTRTVLEDFLKAGLSPKHRYIHNKLKKLTRKAYVELASGGGIELTGRMMAHYPLPDGLVCIPDERPGPVMVSRYPIRDKASFLILQNQPRAAEGAIPGSIYMNDATAKIIDGDFDGDYAIVNTQAALIEAVTSPDWLAGYCREDVPAKRRKSDPLNLLPFIAADSIGNSIGYVTYLIAGCVAEKRAEYVPALSAQLQAEVQKLKWDTAANWDIIRQVKEQVAIPDYLGRFKADHDWFVSNAEKLEADSVIAANTNYVVERWRELDTMPDPLIYFRHLVPLWSIDNAVQVLPEVKAVVSYYNNWISRILEANPDPDETVIRPALDFIRSWAASKQQDREAYAVALWNAVHETRSERSSGSAAFYAFPEETLRLLMAANRGAIRIIPRQEVSADNPAAMFNFAGKSYYRINKEIQLGAAGRQPDSNKILVLPLVGGLYAMAGDSISNKLAAFRSKLDKLGSPLTIDTIEVDGRTLFYAGDFCLGQLPRDHSMRGNIPTGMRFPAHFCFKGRTVYLMINETEVKYEKQSIS